jgi:hypothetical protein
VNAGEEGEMQGCEGIGLAFAESNHGPVAKGGKADGVPRIGAERVGLCSGAFPSLPVESAGLRGEAGVIG